MSKRKDNYALTLEEAESARINTIKHISWVLSTPGMTIEKARAYVDAFLNSRDWESRS